MNQSSIAAGLMDATQRSPHAAALFLPDGPAGRGAAGWRAITNAQLWRRTQAIAGGLRKLGLEPGDRAALLVPPGEDFFALTFGLLEAGVVPVLIDPGIGTKHLGQCLNEAQVKAFIGVPKAHAARLALRWARQASVHIVVPAQMPAQMHAWLPSQVPARVRQRLPRLPYTLATVERHGLNARVTAATAKTAAVLFTSGSTGPPKGVEYTHTNFAGQIEALRQLYDLGPNDVHLATFPPFALFGPALGMPTVVPRMDATRPAEVHPPDIMEALESFNATVMFGSPALLDTVSGWAITHQRRLRGLRLVMSAGAPVAVRIVRNVAQVLDEDAVLVTPYGATEALPVASVDHHQLLAAAAGAPPGICIGQPAPGIDLAIVRITDAAIENITDADLVPAGQLGEIAVAGDVVTQRYLHRPEATRAAKTQLRGKPAHRMGDVGVIADGLLWFCGRKAHMVHTAAGAIATVPVEVMFDAHPWVRRSALIGLGAPGHQRAALCVELAPDAPPAERVLPALYDLAERHARTRIVTEIRVHPEFPVDIRHNAKINYGELGRWWESA